MVSLPLFAVFLAWGLVPLSAPSQARGPSLHAVQVRYDAQRHRLVLTCNLTNGDSVQTFYKPNTRDYCAHLSYFSIQDVHTRKSGSYFPCTYTTDLDHVPLTPTNTVVLGPGAVYSFTQYLKPSHLHPPLLRGHRYTVWFQLNHRDLCGGKACRTFVGVLRSNTLTFAVP